MWLCLDWVCTPAALCMLYNKYPRYPTPCSGNWTRRDQSSAPTMDTAWSIDGHPWFCRTCWWPLSPLLSQPDLQWPNSGLHLLPWSLSSNGGSATPELLLFPSFLLLLVVLLFFSSRSSLCLFKLILSFFSFPLGQSFGFLSSFLRTRSFRLPSNIPRISKTFVAFSAFFFISSSMKYQSEMRQSW